MFQKLGVDILLKIIYRINAGSGNFYGYDFNIVKTASKRKKITLSQFTVAFIISLNYLKCHTIVESYI